jgi:hypothetical protein
MSYATPSPVCQNSSGVPYQLNRVWAFRGKSFPRVKARASCGQVLHAGETHNSPETSVSTQTPPQPFVAGRHGHSAGATGAGFGLALPVDGPLETALGKPEL